MGRLVCRYVFLIQLPTLSDIRLAGGGAYYYAKQGINADRQARWEKDVEKRRQMAALEYSANNFSKPSSASTVGGSIPRGKGTPPHDDGGASPSHEATADPAPTRHAPEDAEQKVMEKSKYEATEPYRARRGDRFS